MLRPLADYCSNLTAGKRREAVRFSRQVAQVWRAGRRLKEGGGQMSAHGYAVARGRLAPLARLRAGRLTDPAHARLGRLWQKHRERLLTFP
jgi:hypothetical protein